MEDSANGGTDIGSNPIFPTILRSREVVSRKAHNLEVGSSILPSATIDFFVLCCIFIIYGKETKNDTLSIQNHMFGYW
jgi:hypothetical protein